jgi:phosphoribosylanthranilate isomerase
VTVDADDDLLAQIARAAAPDWVQAHGSESPARTAALKRFAAKGVIRALGVARATDLVAAQAYEAAADMLLFDAKPPPGGLPGGNAAAFDWGILKGRAFSRPWLLSGGLTPENVREAIAASGAGLVDVSSGVESAPGLKHPGRIAEFLAAARA